MKDLIPFVLCILFWFLIFLGIEKLTGAEWLVHGKYWLTCIVISFFVGMRVGIFLLVKSAINK